MAINNNKCGCGGKFVQCKEQEHYKRLQEFNWDSDEISHCSKCGVHQRFQFIPSNNLIRALVMAQQKEAAQEKEREEAQASKDDAPVSY